MAFGKRKGDCGMILWKLMWPWLRQRWTSLLFGLFLAVVTLLAGVGLFTVAGWFLTGAFLAGSTLTFNLFVPSALVRGLSFLRIAARYAERIVGHVVTFDLLADIRTSVFAQIAGLSPGQLAQYQDGDLVSRLVGDIDALDTLFLLLIVPVLTAISVSLLFSAFVGIYVPSLGVTVLVIMGVCACIMPWFVAAQGRVPGAEVQDATAQARALVHDVVSSHVDIMAFSAQATTQSRFNASSRQLSKARDRVAGVAAAGQWLQQLLMGVLVLSILSLGLPAFLAGQLSAPIWVGLLLGAMGLFEVLGPLMRGAARLGISRSAAVRVKEIQAAQPALIDSPNPVELPDQGVIEFKEVSYAYPGGVPVLHEINLRVEHGERVAVTGASGSGKSTLLSLLLRIDDPTQGDICYGGVPIRQAALSQIFSRFTLLSQDSPVFLGTVRDNLLIGHPDASEDELWRALGDARLADFVHSLDGGLDAWTGEGGRRLSLGQARRLCLARALLTSATVWVLDEPTAGLDPVAQDGFFNDLKRVAQGRTVLLATHAPLPPGTVDRVVTLVDGVL